MMTRTRGAVGNHRFAHVREPRCSQRGVRVAALAAQQRYKVCKQDAMSRAVAAVNSPRLTAIFTGRAGDQSAQR